MEVSIGICVWNEKENIGRLLKLLSERKLSFDLREILVVGGGTDGTKRIIRKYIKRNKRIKFLEEKERKGKATAVNKIIEEAKSDVLIFIGADNLPKEGSLKRLLEALRKNEEVKAVSGRPIPFFSKKKPLTNYLNHLVWELHHRICKERPKISGEMFAVEKEVIERVPNNIINDDVYIEGTLKREDYKIDYVSEAVTWVNENKQNLLEYLRRRRRIARGYIQLKKRFKDIDVPLFLTFKVLVQKITDSPFKTGKILIGVFLEILANLLAYLDTLRGITPYCWKK